MVPDLDRRHDSEPELQTENQVLTSSAPPSPSFKPRDAIVVKPVERVAPSLPSAAPPSSGDAAGLTDVDQMPLKRIKDVYMEAITLEREVRIMNKEMEPHSRAELRRIIEHCRARLDNAHANRNVSNTNHPTTAAASMHAEGPATVHQGVCKPTAAIFSPRQSRLRQPMVRAGGDASTRVRAVRVVQ